MSPKTGITWRLCSWNESCQMPVSTSLDGKAIYCQWHQRCLRFPQQGHTFENFLIFHEWFQKAYPSQGWWGWAPEQLWPVLQGIVTVWSMEEAA